MRLFSSQSAPSAGAPGQNAPRSHPRCDILSSAPTRLCAPPRPGRPSNPATLLGLSCSWHGLPDRVLSLATPSLAQKLKIAPVRRYSLSPPAGHSAAGIPPAPAPPPRKAAAALPHGSDGLYRETQHRESHSGSAPAPAKSPRYLQIAPRAENRTAGSGRPGKNR